VAAGGSSTALPGGSGESSVDHEGTAASEVAGATATDKDSGAGTQGGIEGRGSKEQRGADVDGVEGEVRVRVVYGFHTTGLIMMDWEVDTREALPAPLAPGLHKWVSSRAARV
jgi:hypothetical protein